MWRRADNETSPDTGIGGLTRTQGRGLGAFRRWVDRFLDLIDPLGSLAFPGSIAVGGVLVGWRSVDGVRSAVAVAGVALGLASVGAVAAHRCALELGWMGSRSRWAVGVASGCTATVGAAAIGAGTVAQWAQTADRPVLSSGVVTAVTAAASVMTVRAAAKDALRPAFDNLTLASVRPGPDVRHSPRPELVEVGVLVVGAGLLMVLVLHAAGAVPPGTPRQPQFVAVIAFGLAVLVVFHRWAVRGMAARHRLSGAAAASGALVAAAMVAARALANPVPGRPLWFELGLMGSLIWIAQPLSRMAFAACGRVRVQDHQGIRPVRIERSVGTGACFLGLLLAGRALTFVSGDAPYLVALALTSLGVAQVGGGLRGDRARPVASMPGVATGLSPEQR